MKYKRTTVTEEFEGTNEEIDARIKSVNLVVKEVDAKPKKVSPFEDAVNNSVPQVLKEDEWDLGRENKRWKPAEKKKLLGGWQPIGTGMPNPTRLQCNYKVSKMLKRSFGACRFMHSQLTKTKE